MGLDDAIQSETGGGTLVERIDKFSDPEKCVICGSTDTEERDHDWKCNADDCDVLSYYNSPKVYE